MTQNRREDGCSGCAPGPRGLLLLYSEGNPNSMHVLGLSGSAI